MAPGAWRRRAVPTRVGSGARESRPTGNNIIKYTSSIPYDVDEAGRSYPREIRLDLVPAVARLIQ